MSDNWNAFMSSDLNIRITDTGRLNGRTFAVKDVFEIKNVLSSAGNPDWLRTHPRGNQNAPVVESLLQQGAYLKGTTHTDELMYSLNGENFHYGTPINPRGSDRIPGGSSSGSAVAVAAELVDFAIGTDTGGSVRIPSSYCGLFGFRPTHGVVEMDGVIPLAKSFDTVGWMTREPELLLDVAEILIHQEESNNQVEFSSFYLEEEAWSFVEEETMNVFSQAIKLIPCQNSYYIKVSEGGLSRWAEVFRTIQGIEIWNEHSAWITEVSPTFGPGIADRFKWASTLDKNELGPLHEVREKIKNGLSSLLKENGLLVIPTAPGEAPLRNLSVGKMEQYRSQTMKLTCIAGLSGFPQVTIPFMKENGIPIGLSFIANEHQDLKLLKWVNQFTNSLKENSVKLFMEEKE
ncbi:amidase [Bacillus sp. MRMR6]|uniref:amidase n=1 Tax=Bacillus sp. MRMR6 TaxID=1928617 RepID=UPI000952D092|nr:amidase [Bacillus sp. MRMR6]OLS40678.1 amidase [Bacillus sp. MRMR6]